MIFHEALFAHEIFFHLFGEQIPFFQVLLTHAIFQKYDLSVCPFFSRKPCLFVQEAIFGRPEHVQFSRRLYAIQIGRETLVEQISAISLGWLLSDEVKSQTSIIKNLYLMNVYYYYSK